MASIHDLVEGLNLIAKYEEKAHAGHINGADHDIIYGGGEPAKWSYEDAKAMRDLGWSVYDYGFDTEDYDRIHDLEERPEDHAAWQEAVGEDACWSRFV